VGAGSTLIGKSSFIGHNGGQATAAGARFSSEAEAGFTCSMAHQTRSRLGCQTQRSSCLI